MFRNAFSLNAVFPRRCLHTSPPRSSWLFRASTPSVPAIYKAKKESWFRPTMILVGIMPIFTFSLGVWQLKRLKWKINLIDELEEKLQLKPLPLPPNINVSVIQEFVFRRVIVKGRWDNKHIMLFSPRVYNGVHGFHVVSPLIRENGSTVLVDRGFVSKEALSKATWLEESGEVEVLGMLRTSQPRNLFTPDNNPTDGKWYWTDVDAMAEYAGGIEANVQPVFMEQIFEGHAGEAHTRLDKGMPIGRTPTVDLRNSHLSYVITWFALSGLTTLMFFRVLANKRKAPGRRLPRFS